MSIWSIDDVWNPNYENNIPIKYLCRLGEDTTKLPTITEEYSHLIESYTSKESLIKAQPIIFIPRIKKVIFSNPATIVFWGDNTKTVVKCGKYDTYDPEKGLAMAITKKALGNKGSYFNVIKEWTNAYYANELKKSSAQNKDKWKIWYVLEDGTVARYPNEYSYKSSATRTAKKVYGNDFNWIVSQDNPFEKQANEK